MQTTQAFPLLAAKVLLVVWAFDRLVDPLRNGLTTSADQRGTGHFARTCFGVSDRTQRDGLVPR